MNLYFAAPLAHADRANLIAGAVAVFTGHSVVSRWHSVCAGLPVFDLGDPVDDLERTIVLRQNLRDLASADCVVVLADAGTPRATLVEAGMAIARSAWVVWVHDGDRGRCLFDSHPGVARVDSGPATDLIGSICEAVRAVGRRVPTLPDDRPTDRCAPDDDEPAVGDGASHA